jgi:hypothetical protein
MVARPWEVGKDVAESGLRHLLETLLLLPLVGWEWLIAAAPAAVVYATASGDQLSRFNLYYSAPVIGFLALGTALGLTRIVDRLRRARGALRTRRRLRTGAVLVLLVCAFDGPSYRFARDKPQRAEIRDLVRSVPPGIPIGVQGSLLPHAGYSSTLRPLSRLSPLPPKSALLLDPGSNPYPFRASDIQDAIFRIKTESSYSVTETENGLVLAVPVERDVRSPNPLPLTGR